MSELACNKIATKVSRSLPKNSLDTVKSEPEI